MPLEQMNIVIVGHVDHGKSTLIGRLLADTGSLPEGKLEQVREMCKRSAKPFEYAFLLDALKDEQSQGITIDTARSFFNTEKRHYIIIDAPGHIEFLKNMITGAARAEAALLLIDVKEGVQENSRRHGFMMSFLGIKQIIVLVNKMDLVHYSQKAYDHVVSEYTAFLKEINLEPLAFVPIAAREGQNLIPYSNTEMSWYKGQSILELMDGLEKEKSQSFQPLRFPVQDIYKFTEEGDDRRIVVGTIETGSVSVGDEVVFYPSQKKSVIKTIEGFNLPSQKKIESGFATGFTLETQLYIKPGELMCKATETRALVGATFRANIFWMGKNPLIKNKRYKLKLGSARTSVYLKEIVSVLNAAELTQENKPEVERHEVAECIFQTLKPVAFDISSQIEATGRFVVIDDYEIAGGGIITDCIETESLLTDYVKSREFSWERSDISPFKRTEKFGQKPQFIVITGPRRVGKLALAKALEAELFLANKSVYFLGISNLLAGLGSDVRVAEDREEHIRRLGEMSHLFTDAGLLLISTISDLDDNEVKILKTLNAPNDLLVINVGESHFYEFPVDCLIEKDLPIYQAIQKIKELLYKKDILIEYYL